MFKENSYVIQNKKYGIPLIQRGYKVLDIKPSKQNDNDVAFIFEKTDDLVNEFLFMVNENRISKQLYGLTLYDIRSICGVLQGHDISEDDKYQIICKLEAIDNAFCDYDVRYDNTEEQEKGIEIPNEVLEESVKVDVSELKNAMYDAAFNKAVKK